MTSRNKEQGDKWSRSPPSPIPHLVAKGIKAGGPGSGEESAPAALSERWHHLHKEAESVGGVGWGAAGCGARCGGLWLLSSLCVSHRSMIGAGREMRMELPHEAEPGAVQSHERPADARAGALVAMPYLRSTSRACCVLPSHSLLLPASTRLLCCSISGGVQGCHWPRLSRRAPVGS